MTSDNWKSLLIKLMLMVLTPLAVQLHLNAGPANLTAIATDLADIAMLVYGLYRSKGMKLVPGDSTAIRPLVKAEGDAPKVGDHVIIQDAAFPAAGTSQAVAKIVG